MKPPSRFLSLVLLIGLHLSAGAAQAQLGGLGGRLNRPQPNSLAPSFNNRQLSPSDAARIAQQQNGGGRVLAVERGDAGYRVKLLKNGDVRIVYVPGE